MSAVRITWNRMREEAGAALIEFAVVLPLLAALMLGIVTGGVAFNANVSLNTAARESARYGATLPVTGSMATFLTDVADISQSAATGELDDGVAGRQICVAYVYPDGSDVDDQTTRLVIDPAGNSTFSVGNQCLADGRPDDERRVQVAVQRDSDLEVVFFSWTLDLSAESVVRYERAD